MQRSLVFFKDYFLLYFAPAYQTHKLAVQTWLAINSNENYFPGEPQTYKGLTKSGVALYKRVKFKRPFSAKNQGSHYTQDRIVHE